MTIAITGATGGIGGRVARRLAGDDADLRLVVRDASRAPSLPGASVAEATYADADAMSAALAGVDTLLLVSAAEAADRVHQHLTAVDAAAAAGVARIVYLSFLGAAPDATFTFARDHFHTEERIRAAGVRHTFLRDSLYADYVPVFATAEGEIPGPAGEGRVAWVARDDVAAVAVAVLRGEFDGQTLDVTGPAALSMEETAAALSQVCGREVRYVRETLEEARESRRPSGAPEWEIEGWVTSYAAVASGELDVVSDVVDRLTGRPAEGVAAWLRRHPESWRHLVV